MSAAMEIPGIAAEQCTAKAKSTGRTCRRLVVGGGVCIVHGGRAPQVQARRLERIALAEQFNASPRRHPAEVLMDAVHTSDVLAANARQEIQTGNVTPKTMHALVEATLRQGTLARAALSADAEQRMAKDYELLGKRVERALNGFMATMGLSQVPEAETALRAAVAAVEADAPGPLTIAADGRKARLDEQQGKAVAQLLDWLLVAVGMEPYDPWVAGVIVAGLRRFGDPDIPAQLPVQSPARSWWLALHKRAEQALGLGPRAIAAPLAITSGAAHE